MASSRALDVSRAMASCRWFWMWTTLGQFLVAASGAIGPRCAGSGSAPHLHAFGVRVQFPLLRLETEHLSVHLRHLVLRSFRRLGPLGLGAGGAHVSSEVAGICRGCPRAPPVGTIGSPGRVRGVPSASSSRTRCERRASVDQARPPSEVRRARPALTRARNGTARADSRSTGRFLASQPRRGVARGHSRTVREVILAGSSSSPASWRWRRTGCSPTSAPVRPDSHGLSPLPSPDLDSETPSFSFHDDLSQASPAPSCTITWTT